MASTVASSILRAGRTQNKLSHASAIRSVYTQVGTTAARTATLATAAKNGMRKPRVGVAGATGAVGIEMRKKLEERGFPMESLKLFAHPSEEGTPITFAGKEYKCESVSDGCFDDLDICLFSAGGGFSKEFAPKAAAAGCVVVDNSSVFRMDPKCPLVVPEVNPHASTITLTVVTLGPDRSHPGLRLGPRPRSRPRSRPRPRPRPDPDPGA